MHIRDLWILEIIDFDPKSDKKTGFGLCRRKKIISSRINLNLVAGNVFTSRFEVSWKKGLGLFLAIFGVVPLSIPKFSPRSVRLS